MATEQTENPGERPMSMKERLQAQRRAEAEAAAGGAPTPAAPPVPAAKPVARPAAAARPATPAPSATPAPAATPRPSAAPRSTAAGSSSGVGSRSAAGSESGAAPRSGVTPRAGAASRSGATPRAAPGATPAAPRRDAKAMSADVQREVEMLRKRQDKWLMYGWIVAGVMLVVAGSAYFYSQHKVQVRKDAEAAYIQRMNDLMAEIAGMPLNSIESANKVIARAEETKTTVQMPDGSLDTGWKDTFVPGVNGKITSAVGKAMSYVKEQTTKNELINGLAALEAAIRDAASKKPEELQQLRRRISEYESSGSLIGAEFEARVSKAKIDLNRAIAQRIFEDARAVAAKGEARASLLAYAKAEDELRSLMDDAYSKRNQDAIAWVEPRYQECIQEADKISYAAFTPEIIDKTPWTDVLATPSIQWGNDGLKGFRNEGGQVQAIGSDPGSKREGIFSVGDLENWRDFVMEVEFVPVRGETKLYWRLGKQTQAAPDEVHVNPQGEDGYKAGQTYSITATYIGSKRKFEYSSNLEREPDELELGWRRSRVGAFGALLAEGAEFKITKLRIKVLRGGKGR